MMGLEAPDPWESGLCVWLRPGVGPESPGAETGSPCHRDHYRMGRGGGGCLADPINHSNPPKPPNPHSSSFLKPIVHWAPRLPTGKRPQPQSPAPTSTLTPWRPSIQTRFSAGLTGNRPRHDNGEEEGAYPQRGDGKWNDETVDENRNEEKEKRWAPAFLHSNPAVSR